MADLSITAANVRAASANTKIRVIQLQATTTAGQALIKLASETKYRLADANSGTDGAEYAGLNGVFIAINGGAADEYVAVVSEGDVDLGATLTVGQVYGLSTTPGGIAPVSDLVGYTTSYMRIIGQATETDNLRMLAGVDTGANNI